MNRGEIWIAQVGEKRRPVLVLTRSEVLDARRLVCVAEITTTIRNLASEVELDFAELGLDHHSVVNCDGIHTIAQSSLSGPVGRVDSETLNAVCAATSYALGC